MTMSSADLAWCIVAAVLVLGALFLLGRWLLRTLRARPRPIGRWLAMGIVVWGVLVVIDAVILWCLLEYTLFGVDFEPAALHALMERAGLWAPLASIGLMAAHSFVPFPAELIAIANGMAFGLWGGILVTWLGAMVGAVLAYELARALGPGARSRLVPVRHQARLDTLVGDFGTRTLLIARLIPVISFNLVNYAAGLAGVSRITFLWTTAIGILPVTALSVLVGSAALRIPTYLLLLGGIAVALAVLALHVVRRLTARPVSGRSARVTDNA
jgi:uncharacterized membrane protein YdjX (TVP38/TMEM64 family)